MIKKQSYRFLISIFFCSICILLLAPIELHCRELVGSYSVGSGIVTGVACVITGFQHNNKIRKGDIVVAHSTNNAWDAALQLSAGIITENGGSDSHALLFGKKFGIPVIVGVPGATEYIAHRSLITLDCSQRTVYKAKSIDCFQWAACSSAVPLGYKSSSFTCVYTNRQPDYGWQWIGQEGEDNHDDSVSLAYDDKKNIHNSSNTHHHYRNHIDITLERLRQDTPVIKKYITKVANDIGLAKTFGKSAAWWAKGIKGYTFDSIPFEFFADSNDKAREESFEHLEEGVEYIQTGKDEFKATVLGDATTIDDNKIAEFLYGYTVSKIDVADEDRILLKKDPTKMDELVKKGIIKKEEYMYYILLNFTTRYYLEQELKSK